MMHDFDWRDREDRRVIRSLVGMIAALLTVACIALMTGRAEGAWGPAGCAAVAVQGSVNVTGGNFRPGWYDQAANGRPGFWGYFDGKVYQADYRVSDNAIAFVNPKGEWSPYIPSQMALSHFGLAKAKQPAGTEIAPPGAAQDPWKAVREAVAARPQPAVREEVTVQELPTGVDEPETVNSPSGYFYGGHEVERGQALDLVTNGLPDSKNKPWLIAVGPAAYLEKVGTLIQPYLDKFRVQLYDPADWAVERYELGKNPRFREKGQCLLIQSAGGSNDETKVVHLQYDIDDGAEGLKKVMAAFDPQKVPDLRKDGIGWPEWVPLWARNWQAVAFIVIALLAYSGRKEK